MLEDHAEEVGVAERNRKLQMPPLVWSLVFGLPPRRVALLLTSGAATTLPPTTHFVRVAFTNS